MLCSMQSCLLRRAAVNYVNCTAGTQDYETFLWNTGMLSNLLVVYTFVQALVLILLLCSFIQRW